MKINKLKNICVKKIKCIIYLEKEIKISYSSKISQESVYINDAGLGGIKDRHYYAYTRYKN